jgi:hypothetical protein
MKQELLRFPVGTKRYSDFDVTYKKRCGPGPETNGACFFVAIFAWALFSSPESLILTGIYDYRVRPLSCLSMTKRFRTAP